MFSPHLGVTLVTHNVCLCGPYAFKGDGPHAHKTEGKVILGDGKEVVLDPINLSGTPDRVLKSAFNDLVFVLASSVHPGDARAMLAYRDELVRRFTIGLQIDSLTNSLHAKAPV